MGLFKRNLEDFARKYRQDIRKDPAFRAQFQAMCANIGVDPLASSKVSATFCFPYLADMCTSVDLRMHLHPAALPHARHPPPCIHLPASSCVSPCSSSASLHQASGT